jgi:3-phosphoshikimate 1-carboxyvinyltransferase
LKRFEKAFSMLKIPKIDVAAITGETELPPSKSISHRYLIIQALAHKDFTIRNLSQSNDTLLLQKALGSGSGMIDFEDAGTPMRFYLAYAALKGLMVTITGNEGLRKRPIAPLIDSLTQLGCRIGYLETQGFLPLKILEGVDIAKTKVVADSGLSSQFVSALLLIAPCFTQGLQIEYSGKSSGSYIDLTVDAMRKYGAGVKVEKNIFSVEGGGYGPGSEVLVEADWSAATFLYAWMVARPGNLTLRGLSEASVQGDAVTAKVFEYFGIRTTKTPQGIKIEKITGEPVSGIFEYDFTNTPDMFPALAAVCAYLKVGAKFSGVRNLRLKESDRIRAMKDNLLQVGAEIDVVNDDELLMRYNGRKESSYHFKSYNDHRIAMACSIFAFEKDIVIDDETVVRKSFPGYWEIFRKMGFMI